LQDRFSPEKLPPTKSATNSEVYTALIRLILDKSNKRNILKKRAKLNRFTIEDVAQVLSKHAVEIAKGIIPIIPSFF
jgi:hypothetical protein